MTIIIHYEDGRRETFYAVQGIDVQLGVCYIFYHGGARLRTGIARLESL
jgi:hypothetical protein